MTMLAKAPHVIEEDGVSVVALILCSEEHSVRKLSYTSQTGLILRSVKKECGIKHDKISVPLQQKFFPFYYWFITYVATL